MRPLELTAIAEHLAEIHVGRVLQEIRNRVERNLRRRDRRRLLGIHRHRGLSGSPQPGHGRSRQERERHRSSSFHKASRAVAADAEWRGADEGRAERASLQDELVRALGTETADVVHDIPGVLLGHAALVALHEELRASAVADHRRRSRRRSRPWSTRRRSNSADGCPSASSDRHPSRLYRDKNGNSSCRDLSRRQPIAASPERGF